jgi:protein-L-isoaspartate O-methyltransferase
MCVSNEFRRLLEQVPYAQRDDWWNEVLGVEGVADDGSELPLGCVPYMPAPLDALCRVVDQTPVVNADVFVDVGCGIGRAALFVHLLTGASVVGVDVQSQLVNSARLTAERLGTTNAEFVAADASTHIVEGSVYFLYCPFGVERAATFLNNLRPLAACRRFTVACLDMCLPARDWLVQTHTWPDLQLFRSVA